MSRWLWFSFHQHLVPIRGHVVTFIMKNLDHKLLWILPHTRFSLYTLRTLFRGLVVIHYVSFALLTVLFRMPHRFALKADHVECLILYRWSLFCTKSIETSGFPRLISTTASANLPHSISIVVLSSFRGVPTFSRIILMISSRKYSTGKPSNLTHTAMLEIFAELGSKFGRQRCTAT